MDALISYASKLAVLIGDAIMKSSGVILDMLVAAAVQLATVLASKIKAEVMAL